MSTDALANGWAKVLGGDRKQFDMFFDRLLDGFAYHKIVVNKEGKPVDYIFLEVNHAFEKITGLKREQIIGKKVTEVLPGIEKDPADWINLYGTVALTGESVQFENNSEPLGKWYRVSAYCPEKSYFVALFEDVTERKKAEEETQQLLRAVQQERDRLSSLVRSINDEVWFADTEKNFTLANPTAIKEFKLDSTQSINVENLAINSEVYRPDGSPRPVEEAPPLRALKGEIVKNQEEIVKTPASGELRYRQVSASPVRDVTGCIIGSVSVVHDITELKKAEHELWQAKNDWERTFDSFPDFIAILDNQFRIVRANRAMAQQLGVTPEKAIGLFCYKCVHGLDSPPDFCPHNQTVKDEKEHTAEVHEPRLGGDFLVSTMPLRDEKGCMIGSVHVARNITERKRAEESLKESEERLRFHAENIPLAVVEWDKNFVVTRWAGDAEKMFGWKASETIGKPIMDLHMIYEPDISIVEKTMAKLTRGETKVVSSNRNITKDGRVIYCTWYNSVLLNDKGKMVSVFSFVEDCTSTVTAENALAENNRNLEKLIEERTKKLESTSSYARSLIEASLDPLVTINAKGKITDVNKSTEEVTGYTRNELIGSDFSDYFTEPKQARAGYKKVFTEGLVKDYPLAIRHKSGKITDVLYNATLYRNPQGEIQGVFAAARDITQLKEAEERYQKLFDSIDEGFCIIEMIFDAENKPVDYRFLDVNSSFERQTGMHEAKGKLMRSFAPNHEAYWYEIYGKVALTGKPIRFTNEARALNRWYDVFAFPVGEEKIRKVGILFNDISQRVNLEKQLKDSERLAAIGATAGMVGHDIRNPLQAITSDVYLAKSELSSLPECDEKKNALESLTEIEKNIDYINKIVADLQDFARPLNPHSEEADLKIIINELLKKNRLPKNVKVSVKVDAEASKVVADSSYINRIMYNLVTNAVQAMPDGGKLTIQACKEENSVVITVKDTGVGVPEAVKNKLFTPMFTTKSKGQGFGLPVVKRMTEALGGTVSFVSQEGEGTTFIVSLPSIGAKNPIS